MMPEGFQACKQASYTISFYRTPIAGSSIFLRNANPLSHARVPLAGIFKPHAPLRATCACSGCWEIDGPSQ